MFIGSNAEKVVRTSDVPVLVIKNRHKDFDVNNFVFASNFKENNKTTYLQAVKLAEAFDAKLHLVLVNTANNFITTEKANTRIAEFIKVALNSFKLMSSSKFATVNEVTLLNN